MSTAAPSFLSQTPMDVSSSLLVEEAAELDRVLAKASPTEIIAAAVKAVGRDRLAVVSSFGTESAALLKFAADVDPAIPVVFLDTGWLFEETLAYRDTLTKLLGLTDVRTIHPLSDTLEREDKDRDLWFSNPDQCCFIRKVEPLARALSSFDGWINGRKRFQGGDRASIPVVEADGGGLVQRPDLRRPGRHDGAVGGGDLRVRQEVADADEVAGVHELGVAGEQLGRGPSVIRSDRHVQPLSTRSSHVDEPWSGRTVPEGPLM